MAWAIIGEVAEVSKSELVYVSYHSLTRTIGVKSDP